jgi:homopolymeric O-antigen transport system ATP-binding protein
MIDLKCEHVSKRYLLKDTGNRDGADRPRGLRRFVQPKTEMWALRDVNFQVREGEALGIVGHNGAGKTTILKILSSITTPTTGHIEIRGRLVALVEVSSGFHPELSGRENVYLHGSMLGMRRADISRKMQSIIEFAGVREYIDSPVKRYSSGMYVRLGFSIAAHLDPDILLLDEVLAVGDAAFQAKCLERITELRKSGRTLVFISHDLAAVYRICDRALLLNHGSIVMEGKPRQVIDEYQRMTFAGNTTAFSTGTDPTKPVECTGLSFSSPGHEAVRTGYPMTARLTYSASCSVNNAVFTIAIYWPSGWLCSQLTTAWSARPANLEPGQGCIEFDCPVLPIVPGMYRIDVSIESDGKPLDRRERCTTLRVESGKLVWGDFYIENQWRLIAA